MCPPLRVSAGFPDAVPGHHEFAHGRLGSDGLPAHAVDGQQAGQEAWPAGGEGPHEESGMEEERARGECLLHVGFQGYGQG